MTTPNLEQIARETALKVHGHKSEEDLKYWCSCADDVKVDDAARLILAALRSAAPQPHPDSVRLDWLEKNANFIEVGHGDISPDRAAIDAAREGTP